MNALVPESIAAIVWLGATALQLIGLPVSLVGVAVARKRIAHREPARAADRWLSRAGLALNALYAAAHVALAPGEDPGPMAVAAGVTVIALTAAVAWMRVAKR